MVKIDGVMRPWKVVPGNSLIHELHIHDVIGLECMISRTSEDQWNCYCRSNHNAPAFATGSSWQTARRTVELEIARRIKAVVIA